MPTNQEDMAQFVAAFKEMASTMDEEGARNLLMWSPMFMPTVQNLMNSNFAGGGSQGPKPRLKGAMPREVKHPKPASRPNSALAQRKAHIAKMQAMYMGGGGAQPPQEPDPLDEAHERMQRIQQQQQQPWQQQPIFTTEAGAAAVHVHIPSVNGATSMQGPLLDGYSDPARGATGMYGASSPPKSRSLSSGCGGGPIYGAGMRAPPSPARELAGSPWAGAERVGSRAKLKTAGSLDDEWEDEVDDLLNWTTQLPVPDL